MFGILWANQFIEMADWGMAAVLVAIIALFCAGGPAQGISSLLLLVQRWIWPDHARCEQVSWSDIPDGKIHDCISFCRHWGAHSHEMLCWQSTIARVFNRAWTSSSRGARYGRKPDALSFRKHFLCTDVDTILAFILCTVGDRKYLDWNTSSLHFGDTVVTLRAHCGVLVAHLRGNIRAERVNLTKHEIQMMVQGYPPYYREKVILEHGPCLPHPIRDSRDIDRGGWIVAVGLSTTIPLALYTYPTEKIFNGFRPFQKAVQRVLDVLQDVILKNFPLDNNLQDVIRAVGYMVRSGTGSGVGNHGVPQEGVPGGSLTQLNGQQCTLAMKIFNDFEPLTVGQDNQLRPILAPVLNAAFLGTYRVIQYSKDIGMHFHLPKLLEEHRHKPVYLMDCGNDSDPVN
jgi:hypothetical protein